MKKTVSKIFLLALLCLPMSFALVSAGKPGIGETRTPPRPNVILIVADDLDVESASHMPRVRSLLGAQGTTFENAFATTSWCCPSRASILRGQYTHNHGVWSNEPPDGGLARFRGQGLEGATLATGLNSGGYRTALVGKYLNGYSGNTRYVPPGWDRWYGVVAAGYYGFKLSENGKQVTYRGKRHYQTDVLSRKAVEFIKSSAAKKRKPGKRKKRRAVRRKPFFLYVAPRAPHAPATPADRHRNTFPGASAPRTPSFNEEDVTDKPAWVRDNPPFTSSLTSSLDDTYRRRLQSVLAVDEMVGRIVKTLRATRQLNNTYIIFTSDHGYHIGQHRLTLGKHTAYEEDIRVPLVVRGPGVPAGQTREHLVTNTDFAPTILDFARRGAPSFTDGRSFRPLLGAAPPPLESWRSSVLIEAKYGVDQRRPALKGVRTQNYSYVVYETGEKELYDLREDPYQLQSLHDTANPALLDALDARLDDLDDCRAAGCQAAENAPLEVEATEPEEP